LKIAIDVDGVLADIHTAVFRHLGLPYTASDVKRWDFFDDFEGLNKEKFWEAYHYLWDRRWDLIELVDPECVSVLNRIAKFHRIDVVTCRDKSLLRGTAIWLALKRIPYENLIILPPKSDKSKVDGYDIIVDDNPAMAKDQRTILFVRPWNEKVRGVRRIYKFEDLFWFVKVDGDDRRL